MKRHTLLFACLCAGFCLVLLLSAQTTFGQTVKTIALNYEEKFFDYYSDGDGCLMISSDKYSSRYGEDWNLPSLPMIHVNVLIAAEQQFSSVMFSGSERVVKSDVNLLPNPYIITTNDTISFKAHRSTAYADVSYPSANVVYIGTDIMDGYKLVSLTVCPHKYNAASRTLSFIDNMSIQLSLTDPVKTFKATSQNKVVGNVMKNVVQGLVINGSEIDDIYAQRHVQVKSVALATSEVVDYLIITNNALASAFDPLVKWKRQKGVRTEVVTVEDIYEQFADSAWRDQVKIKHFIEDYKNQRQTKFVLLGGDANVVPIQKCYSKCNSASRGMVEEMIPADVFYASFDGDYGWDKNGDGIIGAAKEDGVDMRPDINLTRISVESISDVNAFVWKTIEYERNPPVNQWKNHALFGGAKTYNIYHVNSRDMSDSEHEGDLLYSGHFKNRWTGSRTKYYDTWSDEASGSVEVTKDGLQEHLSSGYAFIDMICHGTPSVWWFNENSKYSKDAAWALDNSQPSLITTGACETNWFDLEMEGICCLSEAFLRNESNGVVAYLGSSRYGWGYGVKDNPPGDLGSSCWLNSLFYDSLFSNSAKAKHFGELITKAKANMNLVDSYTSVRWLHFSVNPMGDCEMPIYTSTPKTFNDVQVTKYTNGILVNTGVPGCRVCVMGLDGEDEYYAIKDDTDEATFYNVPEHYSVCVTKQDYVPYVEEVDDVITYSGTHYIQNDTLTGRKTLKAPKFVIGSNVTTAKAVGPVIIDSGRTTLKLGTVTIENNFEVKKGAELIIE